MSFSQKITEKHRDEGEHDWQWWTSIFFNHKMLSIWKCGRKKEVGLPTVFFKLIFYASSCPSVALSMFFWTFCHDCCEVQIWHLYLGSRINCYKEYSKVKVSVASQNNFPTNQQFLLKYLLCLQKQEQGACCQHNQKTFWSLPRNCGEDVILDRLGCKCDATWLVVGGK